jgi:indolepyruvate ferredoxin oxidoreductase
MMAAFRVLARFKGLRGTAFDPFGYTAERKLERALVAEYERLVESLSTRLSAANRDVAVELARLPLRMRGFGHVKEGSVRWGRKKEAELLARLAAAEASAVRIVEPA